MRFVSQRVNRNLRNVDSPRERAVRIALIFFVVPMDPWRRLIFAQRLQRTKPFDMFAARILKLRLRVAVAQQAGANQSLL